MQAEKTAHRLLDPQVKQVSEPLNQFRGLLSQRLEIEFAGSPTKLDHLSWSSMTKSYRCAHCGVDLFDDQSIVGHFKYANHPEHTLATLKTGMESNNHTLKHHLNAISFLDQHPEMVSDLTDKKRGYNQAYIEKRLNSMMPGFVGAVAKSQAKIKVDGRVKTGVERVEYLNARGNLLTKMHPEEYSSQATAFPSVPNAFLSILQQLTDLSYRPCPRDNDSRAPGTSGHKKKFDPAQMQWLDTGFGGKSGPKVFKSTTCSMQKNSTTLASPFGFDSFGAGNYQTGFAFDANKCNIDDQYTWFGNGVTYTKPWYTASAVQNPRYLPASFFGVQLNNVFHAAHRLSAPQNEILARPTLESVVAVLAEADSFVARLSALVQCHLVNIYKVKQALPTAVVMLKNMRQNVYQAYTAEKIAEDLMYLFKKALGKYGISHFGCLRSIPDAKKLLRQVWVVKLPETVSIELKRLIDAEAIRWDGKIDETKRSEFLNLANSFSDVYNEVGILAHWAPTNCLEILSVKKGESVDAIKRYLRDLSGRYEASKEVSDTELNAVKDIIMNKPFKGYSPQDVISASAILGEDVMDRMISQLTPLNIKKLKAECSGKISFFGLFKSPPNAVDRAISQRLDVLSP